jgi:hypothetical protein
MILSEIELDVIGLASRQKMSVTRDWHCVPAHDSAWIRVNPQSDRSQIFRGLLPASSLDARPPVLYLSKETLIYRQSLRYQQQYPVKDRIVDVVDTTDLLEDGAPTASVYGTLLNDWNRANNLG